MRAVFRQIKKRDGRIAEFDSSKITTAIYLAGKATGEFGEREARKLTLRVLTAACHRNSGPVAEVEQVQDIVEEILMESSFRKTAKAYILYRDQHSQIRNIADKAHIDLVDQYIRKLDWKINENSNMCYSLQGLNNYISSDVTAEYWLNRIYPPEIRDAHNSGDIHIHDLSQLSVYTYFGKEVVIAKYRGEILTLSFEQLYETAEAKEELLNEKDDAWAKYPENFSVMDKDGWTDVTRLIRKAKNKHIMRFVKNRGGRSVIVTEDHPMITERGETESANVRIKEDKLFTVDMMSRLSGETLFSEDRIDLVQEIRSRGFQGREGDFAYFNGFPVSECSDKQDGVVHTLSFCAPRYIMLTEEFGFFVGLTIAEGDLADDNSHFSLLTSHFSSLERANRGLICQGWSGVITHRNHDDMYELRIRNRFLRFLFEKVFQIRPGSGNETLPVRILSYSGEFIQGIIAGILDGDGAANGDTGIQLRMTSRTLLEQLAVVLPFIGLFPRDRNCEGAGTVREYKGRTITQNFPLYGLGFRKIEGVSLPSEKYNALKPSARAWQDETIDSWHEVLNNAETEIPDEYIYDITTKTNTLVVNGMWNHNCVGWDLKDLLLQGFRGVEGKVESAPPRHLRTALGQLVNFIYTLQGESAGAQAVSSFDTLLAPFVRYDKLNYKEVKQAMQEFVFNSNIPTRVGFQTPFFNITNDLEVPSAFKDHPVIIGGKYQSETYSEFQPEMDILNEAFAEIMMEGDATGRVFTFPIPTYNITKDFDWNNPNLNKVWLMTGKFGIPYFCLEADTPVLKDDFSAISVSCLRPGDKVLDEKGEPVQVTAVCSQQVEETVHIELETGEKIVATPSHRFPTENGIKTAQELCLINKLQRVSLSSVKPETEDVNIVKISRVSGKRQVVDISVASPTHLFTLGSGILSHNSNFVNSDMSPDDARSMCPLHPDTQVPVRTANRGMSIRTIKDLYYTHLEKGTEYEVLFQGRWHKAGLVADKTQGCVELTLGNGQKVAMDVRHEQPVKRGKGESIEILQAKDISVGMYVPFNASPLSDEYKNNDAGDSFYEEDFRWFPIRHIRQMTEFNSMVFCFVVDSDEHLFQLANGMITHNCRLRLDNRELRKRGGGLFGANPLTGSTGVVTINLPRIGYISGNETAFFDHLKKRILLAKESLLIKRKVLEKFTEKNLYPYSKFYLRDVKERTGLFWQNHFSTIGLIGMNEACLNFMETDIGTKEGQAFSLRVMDFIREMIMEIQEETGDLFNLEATPAEGTSYRLAMLDKKRFADKIVCANEEGYQQGEDPYYTNSTQLPVNYTDDIFEVLTLQDELQTKYTGGTVLHVYLGEMVSNIETVKNLVRKIAANFRLPYFTLTPTFSVCPSHGYLKGEQERCPSCQAETEIYSRVVGYLRPVKQWNKGKQAEFIRRKTFRVA